MAKITKHREAHWDSAETIWRLHADRKPTRLVIMRDHHQKRGWGESPSYDLLRQTDDGKDDHYLGSGSVAGLLDMVQCIVDEVRNPKGTK